MQMTLNFFSFYGLILMILSCALSRVLNAKNIDNFNGILWRFFPSLVSVFFWLTLGKNLKLKTCSQDAEK